MSFLIFWFVSAGLCSLLMIGLECWDARHGNNYKGLTVANIALGILLSCIPMVNTAMILILGGYFFSEVAPKIVFFKPKDK